MKKKVYVSLENGIVLQGYRFGAENDVQGELCFSTAMVGYTEALTDPANYGQILVQTFPLIGNYGIIREDMESDRAWVSAYIVREVCDTPSNFRTDETLDVFLKDQGVVGVYGIDTRQLTKILREEGCMRCHIGDQPLSAEQLEMLKTFHISNAIPAVISNTKGNFHVDKSKGLLLLWDMGGRRSQISALLKLGYSVKVLPATASAGTVLSHNADGVVIGDGPGDPAENLAVIEEIRKVLGKLPVLGLGMGHLRIALALGAKTQKQKYGHRGSNQPVKELQSGKIYISEQNHGYEVVTETVSEGDVWFVNVNDGSCEGINYPSWRALTVQFDPESCAVGHTENIVFDAFKKQLHKEIKNG